MLELITNVVAAANPAQGLVNAIKAYLGPIVLLVISIFALKFLLNSQIMAFVMFIIVAIMVALIFYYPGIIEKIAGAFYDQSGASGW